MLLSQGTVLIELLCQHALPVGRVSPGGESAVAREDCSDKRWGLQTERGHGIYSDITFSNTL